jgi:hypothetical protein
MKTKNNAVARTQHCHPAKAHKTSGERPLGWWRTIPAEEFDPSRVKVLRAMLSTIAILDEPAWSSATDGDAVAAIGLALRLNPARSTSTAYDLIMTSLAICATEGNAAACLVMSHILRKIPGAGKTEARIATSWLAHAFNQLLDRRAKAVGVEEGGTA